MDQSIAAQPHREAASSESDDRFRLMANCAPVLLWMSDVAGRCNFFNQRWLDFTGRTMEQELGDGWIAGVHPADAPRVIEAYRAAVQTCDPFEMEYRLKRADGVYRWVFDVGTPHVAADGSFSGFIGSCIDITERKHAEQALNEKEAQYRSIFMSTSDGLVINNRDGYVVEANPAMCEMHGYDCGEFVGLHPSAFIHPEHLHLLQTYIDAAKDGGTFQAQAIDLRKDGTPFHVEVHGTGITYMGEPHVLGVIHDISERKRAYELLEQRVQERTQELTALLDIAHNLTATLELEPLIGLILQQVRSVMQYDAAAVFLLEGADELRLLRYQGPIPQEDLSFRWSLRQALHNREVLLTRQPLIIPDVHADTPMARAWQDKSRLDLGVVPDHIASWMGVPMILRDQVIGMITFDHGEVDYYTPHHAELAVALASQAAVAIENARLFEQAQGLAALMERQKLARELHDSVSQALYGIALGARTARTLLDRDPSRVADPLDYVLSLAEAGLAEMRALIFELRPGSLETEGLVAALTKQTASLRARHALDVRTELCTEPELRFEVKEAFYRIAQEALHNIVKHARANLVDLRLIREGSAVVLEVRDDGLGFDAGSSFPGHLGLRSMRERINALAGALTIESEVSRGTCIRARIHCAWSD